MFINETERTGPVVRVWLAGVADTTLELGDLGFSLEAEAHAMAQDHLGTDVRGEVYRHEGDTFEVIFEAGELA